jgi:fructose-1,6-bisphosphatase/sedoheptulose 1,7-bisphosphatase-like protein
MLAGVHIQGEFITTESIVMRSATHTVRWVRGKHLRRHVG